MQDTILPDNCKDFMVASSPIMNPSNRGLMMVICNRIKNPHAEMLTFMHGQVRSECKG